MVNVYVNTHFVRIPEIKKQFAVNLQPDNPLLKELQENFSLVGTGHSDKYKDKLKKCGYQLFQTFLTEDIYDFDPHSPIYIHTEDDNAHNIAWECLHDKTNFCLLSRGVIRVIHANSFLRQQNKETYNPSCHIHFPFINKIEKNITYIPPYGCSVNPLLWFQKNKLNHLQKKIFWNTNKHMLAESLENSPQFIFIQALQRGELWEILDKEKSLLTMEWKKLEWKKSISFGLTTLILNIINLRDSYQKSTYKDILFFFQQGLPWLIETNNFPSIYNFDTMMVNFFQNADVETENTWHHYYLALKNFALQKQYSWDWLRFRIYKNKNILSLQGNVRIKNHPQYLLKNEENISNTTPHIDSSTYLDLEKNITDYHFLKIYNPHYEKITTYLEMYWIKHNFSVNEIFNFQIPDLEELVQALPLKLQETIRPQFTYDKVDKLLEIVFQIHDDESPHNFLWIHSIHTDSKYLKKWIQKKTQQKKKIVSQYFSNIPEKNSLTWKSLSVKNKIAHLHDGVNFNFQKYLLSLPEEQVSTTPLWLLKGIQFFPNTWKYIELQPEEKYYQILIQITQYIFTQEERAFIQLIFCINYKIPIKLLRLCFEVKNFDKIIVNLNNISFIEISANKKYLWIDDSLTQMLNKYDIFSTEVLVENFYSMSTEIYNNIHKIQRVEQEEKIFFVRTFLFFLTHKHYNICFKYIKIYDRSFYLNTEQVIDNFLYSLFISLLPLFKFEQQVEIIILYMRKFAYGQESENVLGNLELLLEKKDEMDQETLIEYKITMIKLYSTQQSNFYKVKLLLNDIIQFFNKTTRYYRRILDIASALILIDDFVYLKRFLNFIALKKSDYQKMTDEQKSIIHFILGYVDYKNAAYHNSKKNLLLGNDYFQKKGVLPENKIFFLFLVSLFQKENNEQLSFQYWKKFAPFLSQYAINSTTRKILQEIVLLLKKNNCLQEAVSVLEILVKYTHESTYKKYYADTLASLHHDLGNIEKTIQNYKLSLQDEAVK